MHHINKPKEKKSHDDIYWWRKIIWQNSTSTVKENSQKNRNKKLSQLDNKQLPQIYRSYYTNVEKLLGTTGSNRNTAENKGKGPALKAYNIKNLQLLYSVKGTMTVHREEFHDNLVDSHLIQPSVWNAKKKKKRVQQERWRGWREGRHL